MDPGGEFAEPLQKVRRDDAPTGARILQDPLQFLGVKLRVDRDCGQPGSLSLREVLAAGWGDTYSQIRAGQSFNLKGLPNGTYYIATIANPNHRLIEMSTADNTSLRKIVISGKEGNRKMTVPKIGVIEEPEQQW